MAFKDSAICSKQIVEVETRHRPQDGLAWLKHHWSKADAHHAIAHVPGANSAVLISHSVFELLVFHFNPSTSFFSAGLQITQHFCNFKVAFLSGGGGRTAAAEVQ